MRPGQSLGLRVKEILDSAAGLAPRPCARHAFWQFASTTRFTLPPSFTSTAKVRALVPLRVMTMLTPSFSQTQVSFFQPAELAALIRYTAPFDLSGNPTLTVPAAFTAKGLPVAVQFVGKHLGEVEICRAGRAFQRTTDWHRRRPPVNSNRTSEASAGA